MTQETIIRRIHRICKVAAESPQYITRDGRYKLSSEYDRAKDLLLQVPLAEARRAYRERYGTSLPEAVEFAYDRGI